MTKNRTQKYSSRGENLYWLTTGFLTVQNLLQKRINCPTTGHSTIVRWKSANVVFTAETGEQRAAIYCLLST
jgi:hypothetical protein